MRRVESGIGVFALVLLLHVAPAQAQAERTWVSVSGDDANPCTRSEPCRTFTAALKAVKAGGEVDVVDAGGFGPVAINKSVTIDGGAFASILGISAYAVLIDAGPNDIVTLRNLTLDGAGAGFHGVAFDKAAALHIENCRIARFNAWGIRFHPVGGLVGSLYVSNATISDNGSGSDGGGILILPAGSAFLHASLDRVRVENNRVGIAVDGSNGGPGDYIHMIARETAAIGNATEGFAVTSPAGKLLTRVALDGVTSAANFGAGIKADGGSVGIILGNSTVTLNRAGGVVVTNGAVLGSYLTNRINGNIPQDGTPLSQIPAAGANPGPLN